MVQETRPVVVKARPVAVQAIRFDGSEESAVIVRDWARSKGLWAETFWYVPHGSWSPLRFERVEGVRVNGMPLSAGMWVVAGPVVQVLAGDRFEQMYRAA